MVTALLFSSGYLAPTCPRYPWPSSLSWLGGRSTLQSPSGPYSVFRAAGATEDSAPKPERKQRPSAQRGLPHSQQSAVSPVQQAPPSGLMVHCGDCETPKGQASRRAGLPVPQAQSRAGRGNLPGTKASPSLSGRGFVHGKRWLHPRKGQETPLMVLGTQPGTQAGWDLAAQFPLPLSHCPNYAPHQLLPEASLKKTETGLAFGSGPPRPLPHSGTGLACNWAKGPR